MGNTLYLYTNISLTIELGQKVVKLRNSLSFSENISHLLFERNIRKSNLFSSRYQTRYMTINFNMLG